MKKSVIVFGLVALFGLGLVSCKKDCTCKAEYLGYHVDYYDVTTKTKKKDCKDYSSTVYEDGYGYTVKYNCNWN